MIIGVISDTHGLIRDQALKALQGSDVIFHAGDVGSPEIIKTLEEIAPVYAVRGNTDRGIWAQSLSMTQMVDMGRKTFYVIHDLETLGIDPATGVDVVIYGHSIYRRQKGTEVYYILIPAVPDRGGSGCPSASER